MDEASFGFLRDSSDAANDFDELRRRVAEDGYLYMKGYLNRDAVLDARRSLVERMEGEGILDPSCDPMDAICRAERPPNSEEERQSAEKKNSRAANYGFKPEFANANKRLQSLLYAGRLTDFYRQLFAEEIRHYDFTWLRAIAPGKGTSPHCDLPYMGRGTHRHMTCWLPYGDVSFELGGLMILEGSHKRMDLLENYIFRDVDTYCENVPSQLERAKSNVHTFKGTLSSNPPTIRKKFGGRWLTTEFEAGDFLTFGMFLAHASLDNTSKNTLRISSDTRYQRASEPIDDRWIGVNPPGHTWAGKRGRIC
jgi:hypothetical protein